MEEVSDSVGDVVAEVDLTAVLEEIVDGIRSVEISSIQRTG